jgi:hypothetical protein
MTDSFINGFIKKSLPKQYTAQSPYGETVSSNDCNNGFPISKYGGYGVNAWEVLYSVWVANQSTLGAQFTLNQATIGAPTSSPCTGPANIFIIRHGEKNPSPNIHYCLNNNGIYRASQIIGYVNQLASEGTPISYIISCNPSPFNTADPSMRPQQTIMVTAFMLNIPMFIYGGSQDYSTVMTNLFSSGIFNGLNVLICWEHGAIQQLCLNLLNTAGANSRLTITQGTSNQAQWFGDAYFAQNNLCTDGNYSAPSGAYYTNDASLNAPGATGLPLVIGPNSRNYPYWNDDDFEKVYSLKSSSSNSYKFNFAINNQPILTCFASCELIIGLYQPLKPPGENAYKYYSGSNDIEQSCQKPTNWAV